MLIHFGYIGKTFSFSPHHLPTPLPCSVTLFHFGKFWKLFHFSLTPNPIPLPSQHSVTLIHLGHIGKFFYFSFTLSLPTKLCDFDPFWTYWKSFSFFLTPSPLLSSFRKLHWSILDILVKHFIFLPPFLHSPYHALWLWFILDILVKLFIFFKTLTPSLHFVVFLFFLLFVDYKFLTQCICNCSSVYSKDFESRQLLVTF